MTYRQRPLKKFIEEENSKYYCQKENEASDAKHIRRVELVGGELGKWLELILPEDVDQHQIA